MRYLLLALPLLFLAACDSTTTDENKPVVAVTVANLAADPQVITDLTQPPKVTGKFTLYSLKDNKVIANADSNSTKWDIGFRATTIIVNGGTSGMAKTTAQVATGDFDTLTEAPATGYVADDKTSATAPYAVPIGSGKGWYNYNGANPQAPLITPIPGKVIFIKTNDNNYAKIQIQSYYKGAPASPTVTDAQQNARYFTFRYAYQPNGTLVF
jgi:hypothetical protein